MFAWILRRLLNRFGAGTIIHHGVPIYGRYETAGITGEYGPLDLTGNYSTAGITGTYEREV